MNYETSEFGDHYNKTKGGKKFYEQTHPKPYLAGITPVPNANPFEHPVKPKQGELPEHHPHKKVSG